MGMRHCISIIGTCEQCGAIRINACSLPSYFSFSWHHVYDLMPDDIYNGGFGHYTFMEKSDATLFKLTHGGEYSVSG